MKSLISGVASTVVLGHLFRHSSSSLDLKDDRSNGVSFLLADLYINLDVDVYKN